MTNQDYKNAALASLSGNWAPAVLATVLVLALTYIVTAPSVAEGLSSVGQLAIGAPYSYYMQAGANVLLVFLLCPLIVGYMNALNALLVRSDNSCVGNTVSIAFGRYGRNVWGMFLMVVFTALWSLLLVIPGIVKSFSYAMTPYILNDYPELSANQAIDLSQKMMKGHRMDFFCLQLSFIGWIFLAVITLGIGYFWLQPYMYTANAAFYRDVRNQYELLNQTLKQ